MTNFVALPLEKKISKNFWMDLNKTNEWWKPHWKFNGSKSDTDKKLHQNLLLASLQIFLASVTKKHFYAIQTIEDLKNI